MNLRISAGSAVTDITRSFDVSTSSCDQSPSSPSTKRSRYGPDHRHRVERRIELGAQAHQQEQRALEDDDLLRARGSSRDSSRSEMSMRAQVGDALEALLRIELDVLQVERVERDVLLEPLVEVLDRPARTSARSRRARRSPSASSRRRCVRVSRVSAPWISSTMPARTLRGNLGDRAEVEEHDRRRPPPLGAGRTSRFPGCGSA